MSAAFNPVEDEDRVCSFGKHKGSTWTDVVRTNRNYVEWLVYDSAMDLPSTLLDYLENLLDTAEEDWDELEEEDWRDY